MELCAEDALRLNVLLANEPLAIRINESTMTLHALLAEGETQVRLNPNTNSERYLKSIRSLLSERALGSPGEYPLYLQRWARMGRMRNESLNALLKLGDPTAVFAVVCAEGLTDELARRAWWCVEDAENARRMLQTSAVVSGKTGKLLARYLVEYLPFETETEAMMESVTMALQPGLLSTDERLGLWKKALRKLPYLVGFVAAIPDELPDRRPSRPDHDAVSKLLKKAAASDNPIAGLLIRALSAEGQTFFAACGKILSKPPTQDVVTRTFDVLHRYLAPLRSERPDVSLPTLECQAVDFCRNSPEVRELLAMAPELRLELEALHLLSGLGYGVIRPVLSGSNAMGSLMRRKVEPITERILARIDLLLVGHR